MPPPSRGCPKTVTVKQTPGDTHIYPGRVLCGSVSTPSNPNPNPNPNLTTTPT